ncbi:MAG: hypothetical protein R3298_08960 [Gammaproteobacteria bacterium]|nr:hypothetical protein [Gammaproteobacteria bacterium]
MSRIFPAAVLAVVLVACDYTVPLVESPTHAIDASAVGLWQRTTPDGRKERLLVLPLGENEYLVSFPAGSDKAMFARAAHWRGASVPLVQVDWFGTAEGRLPDDRRTFQYADYAVRGDALEIRLLDPEVVPKTVATAEALADAIARNADHPGLFREPLRFRRAE